MESQNIEIRLVMPKDKDSLEILTRELVEEKGERFMEKRYEWGLLRRVYDPLQRHGIFVAEKRDTKEIVGMVFGELRVDPYGSTECHIKQMYVRKPYRRKGIGKALLSTCLAHLKSIRISKVKIDLHVDSVKTKALLKDFKFEPKYIVMELNLEEYNDNSKMWQL
ncbi:MAG: GNAT family N-acetyltransferase [Promethearchaeota archaeon]